MKLDEQTLIEIEDYINHLNEAIGLNYDTVADVMNCIDIYRKKLKNEIENL